MSKKKQKLERAQTYTVDAVLDKVRAKLDAATFDGDIMDLTSGRYQTFLHKGLSCCKCGLVGSFFAKERHWKKEWTQEGYVRVPDDGKPYHFNLYAIDSVGHEVLMTKDHITPKSRGGKNELSNYCTMCKPCNEKKGATYVV